MRSRLAGATMALVLGGIVAAGSRSALAAKSDPPKASALPFIEDDFATALSRSKASGKPLFVEVWAPW